MNRSTQDITSSRNLHHAEGEDYISYLHESVMSNILSRLSTKEAVRTSILSKLWEVKWMQICAHNVKIADNIYKHGKKEAEAIFANFVDRVLHFSPNITSFCLETKNKCNPGRLSSWMSTALGQKIGSFEIVTGHGQEAVVLPFCLLTSPSLQTVKLNMPCIFNHVDTNSCIPNLTFLYFRGIQFVNGNSNSGTLSLTFPVLQTLETIRCKWVNVKIVEIYAPALTKFSTQTHDRGVRDYSIRIVAPRLVKFESSGFIPEDIAMDGGSQVVSCNLDNDIVPGDLTLLRNIGAQVGKILKEFSSLEELKLSYFLSLALQSGGIPFRRYGKLRRLILFCPSNTEQVLELLHTAPTLKYLYINVDGWNDYNYDAMESMPSCIVSHLEEIETMGFWSEEPQNKLVKFLLKNGRKLKKLSFFGGHDNSERERIVSQLSKYPRRQPSLTFYFGKPDSTIIVP